MQSNGGAAATGCYKCGRPGHWSRDCPSSSNAGGDTLLESNSSNPKTKPNFSRGPYNAVPQKPLEKAPEKPKKLPRTMPKLTPELLLSDDGLGYVLRHFPRNFKYRGRGHEVSDLKHLIYLYAEWHSHLIPYYSFDQFVRKVEKVGGTRRVKMCFRELRERVANGGDPSKLHEPPVEIVNPNCESEQNMDMDAPVAELEDPPIRNNEASDVQEEMLEEIYAKATEEPCSPAREKVSAEVASEKAAIAESENQTSDKGDSSSIKSSITAEQKARMEVNRLKALERMTARGKTIPASWRSSIHPTQTM